MKNLTIFFSIIVASLACTGCEDDKTVIEQIIHEQPAACTIWQNADNSLQVSLGAGSQIGVNGQTCELLGNGQISLYNVSPEPNYVVYYPADAQIDGNLLTFTLPTEQSISTKSVDATAFPLYAYTDNESLSDVTFNPVCGGLELILPAADEDFTSISSIQIDGQETDFFSGTITIDATSGLLVDTVNTASSLSLSGGLDLTESQTIYISVPPLTFSGTLDITLLTAKGRGTCTIDLTGKSIEAGKVLTAEVESIEWMAVTYYYGTANSILVQPGTTSVTFDCAPYYTTDTYYAYENLPCDNDRLPSSAKQLWNDVSTSFVSNVSLSDDRKSVTVDLNGESGNALIAIYDDDDNVLWSFHIWVSETNDLPLGTNAKGNSYTMFDRNLGATSAERGVVRTIGLLYQWGNKNPYIGTGTFGSNSAATLYTQSGTTSLTIVKGSSTNGTIDYVTKHPDTYVYYSRASTNTSSSPYWYEYDWLYYGDNTLWGNPNGMDMPDATTINKSIYDPCPEGYRVPPRDAWMAATSTDDSIFDDGAWDSSSLGYGSTYNGQEIWFPTTGLRNRKSGALQESGDKGYYWFNCPDSYNGAYIIVSSSVTFKNNSRANAYGVRCVRVNN